MEETHIGSGAVLKERETREILSEYANEMVSPVAGVRSVLEIEKLPACDCAAGQQEFGELHALHLFFSERTGLTDDFFGG